MTSNSSSLTLEMEHVAKEMYKKNLELAERNKTLSLLRKIEELVLSSVTDIDIIARKVTEMVVHDAGLKSMTLRVMNHSRSSLTPLSVSYANTRTTLEKKCVRLTSTSNISLLKNEHIIAKTVLTQKMQRTKHLYFLPCPGLDLIECREVQKSFGIQEFLVYPLKMRGHIVGIMTVGIGEDGAFSYDQQKDLLDRLPNIISIALDNSMLYQEIAKANERLQELDKLKDDFVSIASHELRTPMTAIKSYLWMALNKSKELDPKIKEYITIASISTDRLIKLVANMLTISRIEGKRLQLVTRKFVLQDLVRRVFDELSIKAKEQHINFEVQIPNKKMMIIGDSDKLHEVIQNLVGNALKFTPTHGSIILSVVARGEQVEVSVKDTGPGMSNEDKAKLFQKFGLMGSSYAKTTNASGTGLGLYISKQIVAMHKGHIFVESELGKGSTFRFTLPL